MAFDPSLPFETEGAAPATPAFNPSQPFEVEADAPPPITDGAAEFPMPQRFQRRTPQPAPREQDRIGRAVRSPWQEGPLGPDNSKPITGNETVDSVLKPVLTPPLIALDAAGRAVSSVARGVGAAVGGVHDALGGDPGMGARLERDIGQLPAALAPLGAPGAIPRVNAPSGPSGPAPAPPGVPRLPAPEGGPRLGLPAPAEAPPARPAPTAPAAGPIIPEPVQTPGAAPAPPLPRTAIQIRRLDQVGPAEAAKRARQETDAFNAWLSQNHPSSAPTAPTVAGAGAPPSPAAPPVAAAEAGAARPTATATAERPAPFVEAPPEAPAPPAPQPAPPRTGPAPVRPDLVRSNIAAPPPMPPPPQTLASIQTASAVSSTEARRIRDEQEQAWINWHLDNAPGQEITFEHEGEPLRDAAVKRGEIENALKEGVAPPTPLPSSASEPPVVDFAPPPFSPFPITGGFTPPPEPEAPPPPAPGTRGAPVRAAQPNDIATAAAHVGEPTEAQKAAGNYQHGHVSIAGLPIAIENPAGSTRSGTAPDGTRWTSTMGADYGRIKRTTGADGDQVDVFLGPHAHEATKHPVWIIDQVDNHAGRRFDEHKAMVGFPTQEAARHAYLASFSDDVGTDRIGAMTQMPFNQFKRWAKSGDTKKPLAYKAPKIQGPKKQRAHKGPVSLLQFLAGKGGLKPHGDLKAMNANRFVFGFGQLVRKAGMDLDRAREAAEEAGYIRSSDGGGTTTRDLLEAIDRETRGQKVFSTHEAGDAVVAEQESKADADAYRREEAFAEIDHLAQDLGIRALSDDERADVARLIAQGVTAEDAVVWVAERAAIQTDNDLAAEAPDDVGWDVPFDPEEQYDADPYETSFPGDAPEGQGGQAAGPDGSPEGGGEPGGGQRDGSDQDAGQPAADGAGGRVAEPQGDAAGGVAPNEPWRDIEAFVVQVTGGEMAPDMTAASAALNVSPAQSLASHQLNRLKAFLEGKMPSTAIKRIGETLPAHASLEQWAETVATEVLSGPPSNSKASAIRAARQAGSKGDAEAQRLVAAADFARRQRDAAQAKYQQARQDYSSPDGLKQTQAIGGLSRVAQAQYVARSDYRIAALNVREADDALAAFRPGSSPKAAAEPLTETVDTLDGKREQGLIPGVAPTTEAERKAAKPAPAPAQQAPGGMFGPVGQTDLVAATNSTYGSLAAPNAEALTEAFRKRIAERGDFPSTQQAMKYAGQLLGAPVLPGSRAAGVVESALSAAREDGPRFSQTAWHGSPHDHERFDATKIGTGEGNQAFGFGHYFANRRAIAEHYRDKLTAKQRPGEKGRLYQVTIPDDHEFLSWDAPLADQSPQVKDGLAKLPQAFWEYAADEMESRGMNPMERDDPDYTGREFYQVMKRYASEGGFDLGADQIIGGAAEDNNGAVASTVLLQNGVAGIRYFDNASRAAGQGSQNYVVFDDAKVAISAKESRGGNPRSEAPMPGAGRTISPEALAAIAQAVEAMTGGQASVQFVHQIGGVNGLAFGPLIVAALNPNTAWTLHHESIHVLRNLGVLRPAEWDTLKAAAEREGWAKQFDILRRYASLGAEAQLEEAVADKFGQWSTAGTPQPKGMVGRAWNRVKGFVARTGNALHGRGFQTADDVFGRIKSGEVGRRQPGSQDKRRGPQTVAEALQSLAMFSQMDAVKAERLDAMLSEMRFALPPRAQGAMPFAPASTFAAPAESRLDSFIYEIQDKHIDTKRVVEAVERAGKAIGVPSDPYLAEELYHGRTAKRTADFINEELRPVLQDMVRRGVSKDDLEHFLHARHAKERNEQIAKINPALPDGGSGMLTADALAYLGGLTADQRRDFSALAQQIDAIISRTQQTLVDYELEAQDTIDTWNNTYAHYVPLYREDMEHAGGGMGTGAGFSVRGGASRRALGSDRDVTNIIGNLALQRERAIVRGEKNIVANALIELVRKAPNADFWSLNRPALKKTIDSRTGLVTMVVDPNYKGEPNVIVARSLTPRLTIAEQTVTFNPRNKRAMRMSRALKNLDMDDLWHVLGPVSQVTRFIAAMNTQYNPVFGITNLIRDVQEGMLNLTTTPIAGKQAQVAAYVPQALAGIYKDLRAIRRGGTATTPWGRLWEDFQHLGGQTGFRDLWATSEDRAKAIEKEIKRVTEGKAKQFGRAVFGWLSDYNEAIENSVRLSAYKVAIDSGMERERAASLAKNLTVNFNRKGAMTTQIAALYAFFNASVQGTTRALQTLTGPAGKMIVGGGLLVGSMQAAILEGAGFTEAEIPGFIREKNVVIPLGGKRYATIPMPLGFSAIPNIGRLATEVAISGGKDAGKKVAEMVGIVLNTANPLGASGVSMQTLAPTVLDPLAAVAENKDWTGRSIARDNQSSLDPRPGHERKKDTATWFSEKVSRALNTLTGGTEFQPGGFSPSPDSIDYIAGQFMGGAVREVMKAEQTVRGAITGDPVPPNKIPLLGRFYGNAGGPNAVKTSYFENIKRLNGHEAEIKGRSKSGQDVAAYIRKHPEATLFQAANREGSAIAKMQKARREMEKAGYPKERLQALDEQIVARMKAFNEIVKQAEKRP